MVVSKYFATLLRESLDDDGLVGAGVARPTHRSLACLVNLCNPLALSALDDDGLVAVRLWAPLLGVLDQVDESVGRPHLARRVLHQQLERERVLWRAGGVH